MFHGERIIAIILINQRDFFKLIAASVKFFEYFNQVLCDEIVANNYVLSLKDYKKVEHEVKTFRNSIDLIEEINELELEFRKIMEDIKGDIIWE